MSYKIKTIIFILVIIALTGFWGLSAEPTSAIQLLKSDVKTQYGRTADYAGILKQGDPALIIAIVIQGLFGLIGVVFFILILWGGFQWMTAAGNEEKIGKAKKLIVQAVIGLAIVMLAFSISTFVVNALEQASITE